MDFGAFPPEFNSTRIYTGPGSAPMMAAAAAWDKLAAELSSAEAGYQAVINGLTGEGWMGPASNAMAAAVAPYVLWMGTTAARAEQAAVQARAAAASFEAAHATTVAPPMVAANRSQLATLVATNIIGQNAGAIAATEAHYGQMWAQDATAMYSYAAASASATKVTPFTSPHEVADPAAQATQEAAVSQAAGNAAVSQAESSASQAMSQLPSTLQQMASPAPSTGLDGFFAEPGDTLANAATNLMSSSFSPMGAAAVTSFAADMAVVRGAAIAAGDPLGLGAIDPFTPTIGGGLGNGMSGLSPLGIASGSMGSSPSVGAMSVPKTWAASVPTAGPVGGTAATGYAVSAPAPQAGQAGMPGVPLAGAGQGRNYGFSVPRYGFKSTVMPRPVVAG